MTQKKTAKEKTIKVTLRTLVVIAAVVVILGGIGGVIGTRLATPTLPPLTGDKQQFVTTVQEVTVSPSTQATALTERLKRSVVLLIDGNAPTVRVLGSGVVITNDGLIVTTAPIGSVSVDALDSDGNIIATSTVGTDVLYGLTYLRLEDGVIPPFELANDNPAVSTQLLALSLSTEAVSARAQMRQLTEYTAPGITTPDGIMRVGILDQALAQSFNGAAVVNDEGRLSGLVSDAEEGHILVVDAIRSSVARIAAGQREANVFEAWGLDLSYEFVLNSERTKRTFAVVVADVTPASPAATAGIRRGDRITKVQTSDVSWQTDLTSLFTSSTALSVTFVRGQLTETVTLNPASAQE